MTEILRLNLSHCYLYTIGLVNKIGTDFQSPLRRRGQSDFGYLQKHPAISREMYVK